MNKKRVVKGFDFAINVCEIDELTNDHVSLSSQQFTISSFTFARCFGGGHEEYDAIGNYQYGNSDASAQQRRR